MNSQIIINCSLIIIGAIIILFCILEVRALINSILFIPQNQRKRIKIYLMLHRGLMIFFFFGYIATFSAFIFKYTLAGEAFVSIIFFLGAVFVYISVLAQSRLVSAIQTTLQGMLPICSMCKKIQAQNNNEQVWKQIEDYISERTDVAFTHGYCPECYEKEMKNINVKQ